MWLIYLRFDNDGETNTYHVRTRNYDEVKSILQIAEQHGLAPRSKLIEYAYFYSHGTIKPKHVPNFHFYEQHEFLDRWERVAG